MKISIAAAIRLLFVLTLLAISVSAQTPLMEQGRAAISRGEKHLKEFFMQRREDAKGSSQSENLSALASLRETSGGTAK